MVITVQIGGNELILRVGQDALQLILGSLLDDRLDLIVGGTLLKADSQVNHGDVGGRHTHGHAGEFAIERWDDLADSLGGTGTAGNDVLSSGTATSPVLGRGTIDSLLSGSVGVDGGHEALHDTEVVIDNLCERGKAVGCAGGIGDDFVVASVALVVDAQNVHWGISGGSRDDDLLCAALQVSLGLINGGEDTGRLDDVVGARVFPWDVGGILLGVEFYFDVIDHEVCTVDLDGPLELTVLRIILEHICLVMSQYALALLVEDIQIGLWRGKLTA